MKPSDDYERALDQSRIFHMRGKGFNGRFMARYLSDIVALLRETGATTMLDYGCGRGAQYEMPDVIAALAGVEVTKYDPAYPPFATEPRGSFDVVICTQVLGSIPISDLRWVLQKMSSLADKAIFIGERLGPVRKRVHANMAEKMPHGWSHDRWVTEIQMADLVRPVVFRSTDKHQPWEVGTLITRVPSLAERRAGKVERP